MEEPSLNRLQQQLWLRMDERNWTVADLHRATGMPYQTVRNLMRGPMKLPPNKEHLERVARALDVQMSWLNQLVGEVFGWHVHVIEDEEMELTIATLKGDPPLTPKQLRSIRRMVEEWRRPEE